MSSAARTSQYQANNLPNRYTPDILPSYLKLADAVLQQKGIEPRSRELASLAVTAVFDVPFIRYAHSQVGLKLGLSQAQVASAVSGRTPNGLTDTEVATYELALKLARARGPLDKASWEVAETQLGREGAARVGHVVAWFVYNSTLLNLGAVEVPSD